MKNYKKICWVLKSSIYCAMLFLSAGCSPDAPDIANFDHAAAVAESVETDSLMPLIYRLAKGRASDIHVNCEGFEPGELFPPCELTRDASVKIITQSFESMGYTADTIVLGEGTQAAYNVVSELKGSLKPEEVVLVACHLDAFYAGADDNGSAVAVMLETARAVRQYHFARTIRFMAFDLEEYGSIGSTRYVEAGYADDIVSGIVMDLVGYTARGPGSQKKLPGVWLPDRGDFLLLAANKYSSEIAQRATALCNMYNLTKLVSILVPGDGAFFFSNAFMRSDHGVLWFKRFPILFLTDTANLRNPNYHKKTDTPETLDVGFLADNARTVAAMVALLAEVQP